MTNRSLEQSYVRHALALITSRYNLPYKKIADTIGVDETLVKNFIVSRSSAKNNFEKIKKYVHSFPFQGHRDEVFLLSQIQGNELPLNVVYTHLMRSLFNIDDASYQSGVATSKYYIGKYLLYRLGYNKNTLNTVYFEIYVDEEYDIPRYRLRQRSTLGELVDGEGIIIFSRNNMHCLGHRGYGNIEMAIFRLVDPPIKFIHGIVLATTVRHNELFSGNIYGEKLMDDVSENWIMEHVRNYKLEEIEDVTKSLSKNDSEMKMILYYVSPNRFEIDGEEFNRPDINVLDVPRPINEKFYTKEWDEVFSLLDIKTNK